MSKIRKISIGNNQDMHYVIGFPRELPVCLIEELQPAFEGDKSFHVYKENESGEQVLWKEVSNVPVTIEYFTK